MCFEYILYIYGINLMTEEWKIIEIDKLVVSSCTISCLESNFLTIFCSGGRRSILDQNNQNPLLMISHRSQYYQSLLPLCNTAKVIIEVKNINNHHQFSQKDWRIMCLCFVWYSFYVSELSNIYCLCNSFSLHKAKVRRVVFSSLSLEKKSKKFYE